jgi:signal transduction histidine kinase
VIALGRSVLATLFLISIWLDPSQPAQGVLYYFLIAYMVFAIGLTVVTWRNWWLDTRLALSAHLVDMLIFTEVVFSTNGYTSPFFLVFMLPLLSAAIRWGWRETMLTALTLTLLYFAAGLLVARQESFELQRFIVRTAHLCILSAILIWFGVHQRTARLFLRLEDLGTRPSDSDPVVDALALAMSVADASAGILVLRARGDRHFTGKKVDRDRVEDLVLDRPLIIDDAFGCPFLFDIAKDRALTSDTRRNVSLGHASRILDSKQAEQLGLTEGLVTDVSTGATEGWLVVQDIPDLSSDYVELGRELGQAVGSIIDRAALLSAFAESAAARTRLTLASDVHDGMVQFLAGATYRIEAISRAARTGTDVGNDLDDLKGLLVEEQRDIRGLVTALRRDREFQLAESVDELRALAARLGQQWSVRCSVKADAKRTHIPIRLQFDLEQLLREAVANAVRHGGASKVDVNLAVEGDQLRFDVRDNGSGFASNGGSPVEPWSLRERVDRANGSLLLVSRRGRTDISISLPLSGASA